MVSFYVNSILLYQFFCLKSLIIYSIESSAEVFRVICYGLTGYISNGCFKICFLLEEFPNRLNFRRNWLMNTFPVYYVTIKLRNWWFSLQFSVIWLFICFDNRWLDNRWLTIIIFSPKHSSKRGTMVVLHGTGKFGCFHISVTKQLLYRGR